MEYNTIYYFHLFAAGVFGLAIGSFTNVIIHRLPRRESIAFPGSHCPSCGSPVRFHDNIPVVSYLLLRGKCRSCGTGISPRYPAVELGVALMTVRLFQMHGASPEFAGYLFYGVILVATALIDFDHMIIPNRLTYPGMGIGVLYSFLNGSSGIWRSLLGVAAGLSILGFMALLGYLFYRRESVGMGDFKLVVVIGLFAGPMWTLVSLALAVLVGGTIGAVQLAVKGRKAAGEVPFGPYISLGALCTLFLQPQLLFLVEQYLDLL